MRDRFVGFHPASDVLDRPERLTVLGVGQQVEHVPFKFVARVKHPHQRPTLEALLLGCQRLRVFEHLARSGELQPRGHGLPQPLGIARIAKGFVGDPCRSVRKSHPGT